MSTKTRLLFLTLTNDVGSDRIVSEFGRHGTACAVLGPPACLAGLSRYVVERFALPSRLGVWASTLTLPARLTRLLAVWPADFIVPLDELAALVLRTIGAASATEETLRRLILRSLGNPAGYGIACHRLPLMQTAQRLGVRVPPFRTAVDSAQGLPFPVVIKRDHSSGSGGVAIAADAAQCAAALRRIRARHAVKSAMARVAGYHHGAAPILLQSFVEGDLAMRTVACREGVVLDGLSVTAVTVHPTKRASTVLRLRRNAEMDAAAAAIVADLGCSGFVSFDFIVNRQDRAFLIEMNPRPIGSTHLGRLFGHDLCSAFLRAQGAPYAEPIPTLLPAGQDVALFPKELERDPASVCLDRGAGLHHDVPWDEPAIVEGYIRHLGRVFPGRADEFRRRLGAATPMRSEAPLRPSAELPAL